ncbi:MAG: hypothetical protein NTU74_00445 [Deltaproteobacteria bacterium]|nr:hypothetical protein [Deltaproteobacteria bacterium]
MIEKIMNFSQQEIWIYGIFITVAMGIAGIVLTHVFAGKREKEEILSLTPLLFGPQ